MNQKLAPTLIHIQKIGERAVEFLRTIGDLCWFAVAIVEEIIHDLRRGKAPFRRHLFFDQTVRVGVEAVPLVFLVSLFLGLTTALLTGYQLRKYGTEDLIPGLVAVSFTRELGPLLTGIVLAARSGAAHRALVVLKAKNETSNGGSQTQVFAKQRRISWARLLARVFKIDVEVCPNCSGRMRIIAAITERRTIIRILRYLKLPTDLPKPSPARAPPQMTLNDFSDPYDDQRAHDND